jgi:hypothetical protein
MIEYEVENVVDWVSRQDAKSAREVRLQAEESGGETVIYLVSECFPLAILASWRLAISKEALKGDRDS